MPSANNLDNLPVIITFRLIDTFEAQYEAFPVAQNEKQVIITFRLIDTFEGTWMKML